MSSFREEQPEELNLSRFFKLERGRWVSVNTHKGMLVIHPCRNKELSRCSAAVKLRWLQ